MMMMRWDEDGGQPLRHLISQYLKCYALLMAVLMTIINSPQHAPLAMFLRTFENQHEFYENPQSDNSQFLLPLHTFSLQHNALEDIIFSKIAPDCSKISICTQEDRNIETFSVGDDFLAESEDHFFNDNGLEHDELMQIGMVKEEHIFGEQGEDVKVEEQQDQEQKEQVEREMSCHDETKNIPKNYIKAIFSFILENPQVINKIMANISPSAQSEVERLSEWVRVEKRVKRYTIQRLKQLWTGECGKAMRVISCYYLRKRSVGYIFGSKIEKKMAHVKHRYKLISGIGNPNAFSSIK